MTTTTIRLEDDLKARIGAAAKLAGTTPHGFMLDAIAKTVEQVEREHEFRAVAGERWARIMAGSETVPWDDAKAWIEARASGERPARPQTRKQG